MPLPDADSPKPRFSELFAYHLRVGTRPPGKARQPGEAWRPKEFADLLGVSDRAVRYWISGEALPSDLNSIERLLFGNDMSANREERFALRDSLVTSQRLAKTAGGSKADSVQQSSEPDRDAASRKREFVERVWDLVIPNVVHVSVWMPREYAEDGYKYSRDIARKIDLHSDDALDKSFNLIIELINRDFQDLEPDSQIFFVRLVNELHLENFIVRDDLFINKRLEQYEIFREDLADVVFSKYDELSSWFEKLGGEYKYVGGKDVPYMSNPALEKLSEKGLDLIRLKISADIAMAIAQNIERSPQLLYKFGKRAYIKWTSYEKYLIPIYTESGLYLSADEKLILTGPSDAENEGQIVKINADAHRRLRPHRDAVERLIEEVTQQGTVLTPPEEMVRDSVALLR